MTDEQERLAREDIQKVKQMISIFAPAWTFQDSKWEKDPIDATITQTNDSSFMRMVEIKGRRESIFKYGDIVVDRKKIDFINERTNTYKNYLYDVNVCGFLFYVFHPDNIIALIRTDTYANNAEHYDKECKKSMATYETKMKKMYKLNIFDENGCVYDKIVLFDLNTNNIIKNRNEILK